MRNKQFDTFLTKTVKSDQKLFNRQTSTQRLVQVSSFKMINNHKKQSQRLIQQPNSETETGFYCADGLKH